FDGLEEVPTRAPDSVLVMLADPYTFPAHLLLDHLNEHAPGLPVVGGMASGGIVAGRTRLIADDEILTEGAIGAILEGAHGATAVVSQGCRPVGETIAISDMAEVGQTVQFQVRDAESAREDLRAMLEPERAAPVAGALLFSCNGRGQSLFGQPDHDIGAVKRAFGDVPVAGFFAAGEL